MRFSYKTAVDRATELQQAMLGNHPVEIMKAIGKTSENDNAMLSVRVRVTDVDEDAEQIFANVVFASNTRFQVEQFAAALGRDPMQEFGDSPIDEAWLDTWGNTLTGEIVNAQIRMSKGNDQYPPKPEIARWLPMGSVETVDGLLSGLDSEVSSKRGKRSDESLI